MMSDGNTCLIYSSNNTRKKITQAVKEKIVIHSSDRFHIPQVISSADQR